MAKLTCDTLKRKNITILADGGYYSTVELKKCVDDNIDAYVPIPNKTKQLKKEGKFTRDDDFIYDNINDIYICPNNKILKRGKTVIIKENGRREFVYFSKKSDCNICKLRDKCISKKADNKKLQVWEHENILKAHKIKMQTPKGKRSMRKRASMVEHPFGTIKRSLGQNHLCLRGLEKVKGENALIMFTYNFKRLLNLIGIPLFKKAILTLKTNNKSKIEQLKEEIRRYILTLLPIRTEFRFKLILSSVYIIR